MNKEIKKNLKEVRKYMNRLFEHLGHHCCSINTEEHNRILDITYNLEDLK